VAVVRARTDKVPNESADPFPTCVTVRVGYGVHMAKSTSIYVPAKDQLAMAQVEILAARQGKTLKDVIGDALRAWLREQGADDRDKAVR
jgi:hypothetical protein